MSTDTVDMAAGANVLRCVADFIASRGGLPHLVSLYVVWSHVDLVWEIEGHMVSDAGADGIARWALAIDDPVTSRRDAESDYTGPYVLLQVAGTVHGHPVRVWTHLPREGA